MRCDSCGKENPPGSRFCIHCVAGLTPPGESAQDTGPGKQPEKTGLDAIREDLSSIEFVLREFEESPQEVARRPEDRETIRDSLLARRDELDAELSRAYGSLPPLQATRHLRDLLELRPTNVHAHLELGRVYRQSGQHGPAVDEYVLAALLDPEEAEPHLRLADLYERLDRKAEALYEYSTYLAMEFKPDRRRAAESRVRTLEEEMLPERPEERAQTIDETPRRLESVISTLEELYVDPDLPYGVIHTLIERYAQRLDALTASPASVPPATAEGRLRPATAPTAPARPPRPPAAPPAPREPFDWGAFWSALFSERTLTAILGFGVLLVTISSMALLITLWQEAESWADVWLTAQIIMGAEFVMFLVAGYVLKERLNLHLTGLAVITIAALWVPLNVGTLLFQLFTDQINAQRELAGGDYTAIPGIGVPLDLPTYAWLIIASTCIPTWAALTYRFRGHMLTHGTVASVGATVALTLAVLGLDWEWQVAALGVLTVPLLFTRHYLQQTSFRVIAKPLFWTAQAVLLGVTAGLLAGWALGEAGSYSLALVGLSGTALYAAAHRFSPNLAYEYMFSGLPVIAILFALAEGNVLDFRYYELILMGLSAIYFVSGRVRERTYRAELLRPSRWPLLQSAYAVAYVCAAAAILWPQVDPVSRLAVLYGATALALASARRWDRPYWTYLAGLLLLPAFLLTLDRAQLPVDYWSVALGALAWVYLAGGVALRRAPTHAIPMFIVALTLPLASLAWAATDSSGEMARWTVPLAGAIYGASAIFIHRRSHPGLHNMMERIVTGFIRDIPAERGRQIAALGFGLATALLLPLWVSLVLVWQGVDGAVHAYNPLGWAFVSAVVAHFALRRHAGLYARGLLAFGAVLAVSAVFVGLLDESRVVLAMVLYGATALSALYRFFIRSEAPLYLSAVLLLAPFGLTLDLIGVPPLLWSTPLMALAAAYIGLALLMGRIRTTAADPLLHVGYGVSAVALVWSMAVFMALPADVDISKTGQRLLASVGPFLAAVVYSLTAYRHGERLFGHLATWVLTIALGMVLIATPLSLRHVAIAVAIAAVAYVLAGVVLRALRGLQSEPDAGGPSPGLSAGQRVAAVFSQPFAVAGHVVALTSVALASYDLLARDGQEVGPANIVYMINVALLGGSAYLFRAPAFASGAATLFLLPFTLLVYRLFGEASELIDIPSAALAFGWSGLAVGYLALGLILERSAPRHSTAFPVLGYLALLAAVVAALGSAERQSVVFGVIVVVAGASALLTHRRLTSSFVHLVSKLLATPLEATRRYAALAFTAVASLLSPLWGLEILALFTTEAPAQGLVLALAAPVYVLAGAWISRRADQGYAAPLYTAGFGMTVVAPLLTLDSQPLNLTALAVGSATYALSIHIFRRHTWAPLLLYPSLGLAVASYAVGLALLPMDSKYVGLTLMPGAVASLAVGWLLHRSVGRPGAPSASPVARYTGAEDGVAWEMPFLVAGYGLSLAAVALSLSDEWLRLYSLLAVTGIYAVSLGVFRSWGWLYPLLTSAHLAFAALLTLPGLELSRPVIGIIFLPATLVMAMSLGIAARGARDDGPKGLLVPWAIPFIVFGALDMGPSIVLAAGADWAGLTVSVTYAVFAAIGALATMNRILPYVTTAFVTASVIFTSRMLGLGWSESAVVWASQGFLMWWGGRAFGALSRRGRLEANVRTRLLIWQSPLLNAGLRLSWFALAFVAALLILGPVVSDGFDAQLQDATAVLAILGLLYLGMAFIARREWFGYLAVALLLTSWTIQLVDLDISYVQAYAIPAGLYLLGIAYFERRRSPGNLPAFIDTGAVLLLVVSSFWQSVVDAPAWAYAILLGVESFLLVAWGAVNNTKVVFAGGIVAFAVNVLYQTSGLLSTLSGAAIGLTIGLLLVALIASIEWKRERLILLGREWTVRLNQWSW